MAFNYTRLRDNVVQKQIKDKGKLAVLLLPGQATSGQPAWDPEPGEPVPQEAWVLQTSLKKEDIGAPGRAEGKYGNVQATDSAYLVSPEGVLTDPELVDRMRLDGKISQVVAIRPLKPGPVTMLWKLFARR